MRSKTLLVPVHLDALYLEEQFLVTEAFADFKKLPYRDEINNIDINADTTNISESILSLPFQNQNLHLQKGLHLHWSMPDALTKGTTEGGAHNFPSIPDRWLITRRLNGKEERWVVESNYMSHDDAYGGIAYPEPIVTDKYKQPFCFLGRQLPFDDWIKEQSGGIDKTAAIYLPWLTAIGYGEPTFAAFYPNCHSVFGFHDADITKDQLNAKNNVSYQVIGWYNNVTYDPLNIWLHQVKFDTIWTELTKQLQNDNAILQSFLLFLNNHSGVTLTMADLQKLIAVLIADKKFNGFWRDAFGNPQKETAQIDLLITFLRENNLNATIPFEKAVKPFYQYIKSIYENIGKPILADPAVQKELKPALATYLRERLGWYFDDSDAAIPETMYCYAQLDFISGADALHNQNKGKEVTVSIGNTGTEALSAYLATTLAGQNANLKHILEEQLECLQASESMTGKELDLGARFKEARHEKSFKAEKGGSGWEIRPSHQKNNERAQNSKQEIRIALPPGCINMLDELNDQQQQSNQLAADLRYKKRLLFTDWYKYMICAYPPDDSRQSYPGIDLVKYYIEQRLQPEPMMDIKPAILPELNNRILQFNNSDVACLLSYKLHKKNAGTKGITFSGAWVENLPFSEQCLQFTEVDKNYLNCPVTDGKNIQAISLWVNLSSNQNNKATLLATQQRGTLLGKSQSNFDGWKKIAINGQVLPASSALTWDRLAKDRWMHVYLEWEEPLPPNDVINLFATNNKEECFNGKLASLRLFAGSLNDNELMCDMNLLGHMHYELREVPGPRFWQPTEPVILLEGDAVKPTNRHGADGRLNEDNTLACDIIYCDTTPPLPKTFFDKLSNEVDTLKNKNKEPKISFDTWTEQPWHPFLLEWDVEVRPMEKGGNLATANRAFDPEFIIQNYSLPKEEPELMPQNINTTNAAASYKGRSILTPHAKKGLFKTIQEYLKHLAPEDCYLVLSTITDDQVKTYKDQLQEWFTRKPALKDWYPSGEDHKKAIEAFRDWYIKRKVFSNGIIIELSTLPTELEKDFIYTTIRSALDLFGKNFLSQALSGFNNALLMHHQTLQLPVADPLGFAEYQKFTERVASIIQRNNHLAPIPHNDFLPIRSGKIKINRLRLIDSFGQAKDISMGNFIRSESLTRKDLPDDAWLPPRFVPPVRINLRWLSARSDRQELNVHPNSSPICGWLMANHLDNSIMVYDAQGAALGSINQDAIWQTTPGNEVAHLIEDILNPHLRKVVAHLAASKQADEQVRNGKKNFLPDFITATDRALDHMHPETDVHHQEIALLMGRPMAVVRAFVALQTKEGIPVHHGWDQFITDLQRDNRETNDFEKVKIPVRLGERNQLNDGLVGYWLENETHELLNDFYSTGKETESDVRIASVNLLEIDDRGSAGLQLDLEATSQKTLTMLVDPRGDVHATTGILPVKSIHIPRNMYTEALKNINITFLTAPVLTGKDQVALPLSREIGYAWSWVAKDRFTWVEIAQTGIVRKDDAFQKFDNPAGLWKHLLEKGWLQELDSNRARVVPDDQRKVTELDAPFNKNTEKILHWLSAGHILPADTSATFNNKQVIREGWLKLSINE
jgi:hypothetical protein